MPPKTKFILALLVLDLAGISGLAVFKSHFVWRTIFLPGTEEVQYDSHADPHASFRIQELKLTFPGIKAIDVHFKMKAYSFSAFTTLFQTAYTPEGMRMDIDSSGRAGFVLGRLKNGDINRTGTFPLKVGEWADVRLRIHDKNVVEVQVNGKSVFYDRVNGGIYFSVSDVVIASDAAKIHPFDGALSHFQFHYYDAKREKILRVLNIVLVSLVVLVVLVFRRLLFSLALAIDSSLAVYRISDKKRFWIKCALLLLPVLAYLGSIEYHLAKMVTNYSQKRAHFESRLADIDVLILGSSNAFYGINPRFLSYPGFNVAYRGQAMYYDDQIIKRYLDRIPHLKIVVIPVVYLTFGTHQYQVDEPRAYLYQHYWRISPEARPGYGLDLAYRLDSKRFSLISTYGDRTLGYIVNGYKETLDPDPDNIGWFDSGTQSCDVNLHEGPDGARAHNSMVHVETFEQNAQLLQDIIDHLKKRDIVPILIQLPLSRIYTDYLDKAKWDRMENVLHNLALKNNISYLDYTFDDQFSLKDFTDMPDHLNALGAEKFSRILNTAIVSERHLSLASDGPPALKKTSGVKSSRAINERSKVEVELRRK